MWFQSEFAGDFAALHVVAEGGNEQAQFTALLLAAESDADRLGCWSGRVY